MSLIKIAHGHNPPFPTSPDSQVGLTPASTTGIEGLNIAGGLAVNRKSDYDDAVISVSGCVNCSKLQSNFRADGGDTLVRCQL